MMKTFVSLLAGTAASLSLLVGAAFGQGADVPPLGADELAFSIDNMDTSVDPAVDFHRYVGDNHAPYAYRAVAPLRHLRAFYEAFGIEEGNPMWLPPENRVRAW